MPSFSRNASYPNQGAMIETSLATRKSTSTDQLDRPLSSSSTRKIPFLQRMKKRLVEFFQDLPTSSSPVEQSTFIYDPEIDLREEHLSLLAKRLLFTLRESKVKHLSCDHLFLPCNHLRNIARQCLIMSAEEPFGIMGAQIRIKLTLSSNETKYLPVIRVNPEHKTIFEIEIDLDEDRKVLTLRRLLPEMKMFQSLKEKSPMYVSPRCLLIKRVFYKTAQAKRAFIDS